MFLKQAFDDPTMWKVLNGVLAANTETTRRNTARLMSKSESATSVPGVSEEFEICNKLGRLDFITEAPEGTSANMTWM